MARLLEGRTTNSKVMGSIPDLGGFFVAETPLHLFQVDKLPVVRRELVSTGYDPREYG